MSDEDQDPMQGDEATQFAYKAKVGGIMAQAIEETRAARRQDPVKVSPPAPIIGIAQFGSGSGALVP